MPLYLGGERLKLKLGNVTYELKIYAERPEFDTVFILSSDGYVLTDSNLVYLTPKESDE